MVDGNCDSTRLTDSGGLSQFWLSESCWIRWVPLLARGGGFKAPYPAVLFAEVKCNISYQGVRSARPCQPQRGVAMIAQGAALGKETVPHVFSPARATLNGAE